MLPGRWAVTARGWIDQVCACCAVLGAVLALVSHDTASADQFQLAGGGVVEGRWLNRSERSPACYQIQSSAGLLTLDRAQVVDVVREPAELQQYEQWAPTVADTVEGQWRVAEWCRERKLKEQREQHLRRVLQLDPDHAAARRALGYQFMHGRWVTREEEMSARGYVLYEGGWRLPQEVALHEATEARKEAERKWYQQLRRWRQDIRGPRGQQAAAQIAAVREKEAIPALRALLSREKTRAVKLLYVEALSGMEDRTATRALVELALSESDAEVFHATVDRLVRQSTPGLLEPFLAALRHEENDAVNRAAIVLRRLEDPAALEPLIDALVTVHEAPEAGTPRRASAALRAPNDSQLKRGVGHRVVEQSERQQVPLANTEVLKALISLSGGVNFDYDKVAWKSWYEGLVRAEKVEPLRRQ